VRIVIDASVAVKWVLDEPESQAAVALGDQELIAPALWLAEAANALWRRAQAGEITNDQAGAFLSELRKGILGTRGRFAKGNARLYLGPIRRAHPSRSRPEVKVAHRRTHAVTADRRYAAAASTPALAGSVRLLTV